MKNILITGSVLNSDENSLEIYKKLVGLFNEDKYNVSSPIDTMKFRDNDEERYDRTIKLVKDANFIIAEMSIPSTCQGMELQQAIIDKIPILVIAKNGSKISGLIKGSKGIIDVLFYDDIDDIFDEIVNLIK